ncbi:MAG: TRAP transporter large permease [Alphaproteobacteria bacterium]
MGPELIILFLAAALICVLLSGFPVSFVLGGVSLIAAYIGVYFGVFNESVLGGVHQQVEGVMESRPLLAVPLFVFMGLVLERSQIAEELLSTMGRLFGSLRGGLAISVCIVGALLAASTGIVGATVVTMGLLSLPTMLKAGYNKELATGTICASGTLGQLIPPSIVLIILGDQMQSAYDKATRDPAFDCDRLTQWSPCENLHSVSVSELFAGAFIPGLVLVSLYILYILIVAWFKPSYAPAAREKGEVDPGLLRDVAVALLPPLFLIVAVLGSILLGVATPTEAAAIGATVAMLIAAIKLWDNKLRWLVFASTVSIVLIVGIVLYGRVTGAYDLRPTRANVSDFEWTLIYILFGLIAVFAAGVAVAVFYLGFKRPENDQGVKNSRPILIDVIYGTLKVSTMVFVILIGARALTTVFVGFHGDTVVKDFLTSLPGGFTVQIMVVMLIMFLLGFFLDFIEIAFIVVPIVAPILLLSGINPVWLGVLFAMNLQTSFLTPPFGFALFYLRGVAPPEVKTSHIYKGIIPFVMIQIVGLCVLYYFEGLATWLPGLMF